MKKFILVILFTLNWLFFSLSALSNPAFQANYAEALQKSIYFFDAQRSGKLQGNRVPWRADSALNDTFVKSSDGTIVDLSGGYYDAGDNIKYGFPFAYSTTVLAWSILEFSDSYTTTGQLSYALTNLKWATDYLLKAWHPEQSRLYAQVGTTNQDHDFYYVPYEVLDLIHQQKEQTRQAYYIDGNQYPGSDLAGSTASALAAASLVFSKFGSSGYSERLLTAAQEIYQFGKAHLGIYSDSIANQGDPGILDAYNSFDSKWGSEEDKKRQEVLFLGLAAAWLAKVTGQATYIQEAINYVPPDPLFLDRDSSNWCVNSVGSFILLSQLADAQIANSYHQGIKNWLNLWQKHKKSPDGLIVYSSEGNLSYISNMGFFALVYSKKINQTQSAYASQIQQFVKGQADYMLGNNHAGMSYLVGYGTKWPIHIQHATAQGGWSGIEDEVNSTLKKVPDRHIHFGALVGGPNSKDVYNDDREHYQSTETAIDYVAGFQGMVAGLNELYPHMVLTNFPEAYDVVPPQAINQYYVETSWQNQSSNKLSVQAKVYNHSYWPATIIYKPSVRVYVNVPSGAGELTVTSNGVILSLQPYNTEKGLYYFTLLLNQPIYPGGIEAINQLPIPSYRTFNFTLVANKKHDFTKDWSLQNLSATKKVNVNMVFYGQFSPTGNSVRISGNEPSLL